MLENSAIYIYTEIKKLDFEECKVISGKDVGELLARISPISEMRNKGDLHTHEHMARVNMHADLVGSIHPVGIGVMLYILFVVCAETLYIFAVPLQEKSGAAEKLTAILTKVSVHKG